MGPGFDSRPTHFCQLIPPLRITRCRETRTPAGITRFIFAVTSFDHRKFESSPLRTDIEHRDPCFDVPVLETSKPFRPGSSDPLVAAHPQAGDVIEMRIRPSVRWWTSWRVLPSTMQLTCVKIMVQRLGHHSLGRADPACALLVLSPDC